MGKRRDPPKPAADPRKHGRHPSDRHPPDPDRPDPPPPDQAERDLAVHERARNVLIDAGAGTGKTTTLVRRIVALVAPGDDGPALELGRIAAVTFTRKAAGELRLRIRQQLLAGLEAQGRSDSRRDRLRAALGAVDTAYIGTIHSFCDRLLRRFPMEARLTPSYEIAEDTSELEREVLDRLVAAAESATLAEELAGLPGSPELAAEAERTVRDYLDAGLRPFTADYGEHAVKVGLDGFVSAVVQSRDIPFELPTPGPLDQAAFRARVAEFQALAKGMRTDHVVGRWSQVFGRHLAATLNDEPSRAFERIRKQARRGKTRKSVECAGDERAWSLWKAYDQGEGRPDGKKLRDALEAPFAEWIAVRLVRLRPVILALYRAVKREHGVVDQVDLLLELRDLMRDHAAVRAECQGLFDHVLVDEFQDTDPLQAEIVLYLCEAGQGARDWREVQLQPGKLTVVGDPQQSIYRFRRADIRMYDDVRRIVARGPCCEVTLSANFRSAPSLIDWFDARLPAVLGQREAGQPRFDPEAGTVTFQPLLVGTPPAPKGRGSRHVHGLELAIPSGEQQDASAYRDLEARALAHYLRWLVEVERPELRDPATKARRPVRYGDVAVLAIVTSNLRRLFAELDALGVPHSVRGGTLFLQDPLHQQLLLGFAALANPDDGVAELALLRPPFFALDPLDLLREQASRKTDGTVDTATADPRARRVREALAIVRGLRERRSEQSPGATARDLVELTAFGRIVALGANGRQRLERLYELCLRLNRIAAEGGLGFDGAAGAMREWLDEPVQLDPPHPIASEAVQVLTVHQAKGLEFPVTVLWDARQLMRSFGSGSAFDLARDGREWSIALDGLAFCHPPGSTLADREQAYADAEKRRLVYVAATRARDLLVLPAFEGTGPGYVTGCLLDGDQHPTERRLAPYVKGAGAPWSAGVEAPPTFPALEPTDLDEKTRAAWHQAVTDAVAPHLVPSGIAAAAHGAELPTLVDADENTPPPPRPKRAGRHGATFGDTVHHALGTLLSAGPASAVDRVIEIVQREAAAVGLDPALVPEARADVERTLTALTPLLARPGVTYRLEFPVAGALGAEHLLAGYVDLVVVDGTTLHVVDFKTDTPPEGEADVHHTHPAYCEQVRTYVRLLEQDPALARLTARPALLFTASGTSLDV